MMLGGLEDYFSLWGGHLFRVYVSVAGCNFAKFVHFRCA